MQLGLSKKTNRAFGLVEVLIGAAIMVFVIFGAVTTYFFYLRIGLGGPLRIKASLLAEEGIEAVKFIRDSGWSNIDALSVFTPYYLHFDGSNWIANTTPVFPDSRFDRTFVLADVYRATSGEIVSSGGVLDNGTKKLTVTVHWSTVEGTTTKNISTYITNIFND